MNCWMCDLFTTEFSSIALLFVYFYISCVIVFSSFTYNFLILLLVSCMHIVSGLLAHIAVKQTNK